MILYYTRHALARCVERDINVVPTLKSPKVLERRADKILVSQDDVIFVLARGTKHNTLSVVTAYRKKGG